MKLQTDKRNALYFGKYKYRARCRVHGAVYTYYTKSLDEFKAKMAKRAKQAPTAIEVIMSDWRTSTDMIDYDQISKYFDWRNNAPKDEYLARIQGNKISFFSDDVELLKTLKVLDKNLELSVADVIQQNIMYFKRDPQYKYRTFFRGKRAPESFKEDLKSFMERYHNTARICPALRRLATDERHQRWYPYLHSSYYVDYNDESTLTLLHMFFGSMLAKTYVLAKEP